MDCPHLLITFIFCVICGSRVAARRQLSSRNVTSSNGAIAEAVEKPCLEAVELSMYRDSGAVFLRDRAGQIALFESWVAGPCLLCVI